jgi:hypothetical protein
MRTLFAGEVHVDYGQVYVESGEQPSGPTESFTGQANGLCGAVEPGSLFLITGLHTGNVGFTVELHDGPPPIDDAWEEVVEVSFRPTAPHIALVQWAGEASWDFDLAEIDYRVRYCATGMQEARDHTRLDDDPMFDRYLLQFWPSTPAPDRVVKQTTEIAAYWHDDASGPAQRA